MGIKSTYTYLKVLRRDKGVHEVGDLGCRGRDLEKKY